MDEKVEGTVIKYGIEQEGKEYDYKVQITGDGKDRKIKEMWFKEDGKWICLNYAFLHKIEGQSLSYIRSKDE